MRRRLPWLVPLVAFWLIIAWIAAYALGMTPEAFFRAVAEKIAYGLGGALVLFGALVVLMQLRGR